MFICYTCTYQRHTVMASNFCSLTVNGELLYCGYEFLMYEIWTTYYKLCYLFLIGYSLWISSVMLIASLHDKCRVVIAYYVRYVVIGKLFNIAQCVYMHASGLLIITLGCWPYILVSPQHSFYCGKIPYIYYDYIMYATFSLWIKYFVV